MTRLHNFSPGPGGLPEPVVRQTQEALWELDGCGQGLVETSHRGAAFEAVHARAKERLRRLLKLDDDQVILLLHGGARTQFYQVPMNLLRGGRAAFIDTGAWSTYAIADAKRFGDVDVLWSSKDDGFSHVPQPGDVAAPAAGTRYLHYTSNNTIAGTAFFHRPDAGDAWLMCDASSDILSQPMDGSAYDLLYAGAQKNLGASGVTLVVLRQSLIDAVDPGIPDMLRYDKQAAKNSMLNTPCTFAIYVLERTLAWLEAQGGPEAMATRNAAQAATIYDVIDSHAFWQGKARESSRSWMNITFTSGDADRDMRFVAEATDAGLLGLKGHRSVGGLRASLYNAQTDAAVDALAVFMRDFARANG